MGEILNNLKEDLKKSKNSKETFDLIDKNLNTIDKEYDLTQQDLTNELKLIQELVLNLNNEFPQALQGFENYYLEYRSLYRQISNLLYDGDISSSSDQKYKNIDRYYQIRNKYIDEVVSQAKNMLIAGYPNPCSDKLNITYNAKYGFLISAIRKYSLLSKDEYTNSLNSELYFDKDIGKKEFDPLVNLPQAGNKFDPESLIQKIRSKDFTAIGLEKAKIHLISSQGIQYDANFIQQLDSNGNTNFEIDTSQLPAGIYNVLLDGNVREGNPDFYYTSTSKTIQASTKIVKQ